MEKRESIAITGGFALKYPRRRNWCRSTTSVYGSFGASHQRWWLQSVERRRDSTRPRSIDISIYRSIESFQKQDTPIKPWATIALQQSRMLIQSNLLDESTVFVSTGLGGHDTLLRYFCVYVANEGVTLQPFQWDIAQKETELVISKSQGEIEQIEQFEKYITFTLLLPIEANLKEIFNSIIDECNTYGNFLSENIIITNVKKLSTKEIEDFLETKSPPKHKSRPF